MGGRCDTVQNLRWSDLAEAAAGLQALVLAQPGSGEMSLLSMEIMECERSWEVKAMADQPNSRTL